MTDKAISPLRRRMIEDMVARFLEAAPGLKYRAALSVAYGAGLRANEVVSLKLGDIDSARMVIRVEQGKRRKDRYVMLSEPLLELLRAWWKAARPDCWLFPGQNRVNPLTTRQLNRACHAAAQAAEIDKRVSLHTLRHRPWPWLAIPVGDLFMLRNPGQLSPANHNGQRHYPHSARHHRATLPAVSSPEASRTPAARACRLVHQRQASAKP
jgi:hypothetical protein